MEILKRIVIAKEKELALKKQKLAIADFEASKAFQKPCISLKNKILSIDTFGIIAEFKRRSPSNPNINLDADVEKITSAYAKFGASGNSILTNNEFFGGSINDVTLARQVHNIPILRKEFIIDEFQIYQSKAIGADVILLIAEILDKETILKFTKLAKSIGLEVLLELHSETELHKINDSIDIVGINNRNLKTMTVDINTSLKLFDKLPTEVAKISESGISNVAEILKLSAKGFNGFLIGEYFMRQTNTANSFKDFMEHLNKNYVS